MCAELDMLENMTEEEKEAYYEKKFAEEDAKAAAEIEAQKKAAEERGYSFVGTVENGKKVWRYQLEANNKTRFNLKELSIKYRKEKGLETVEDIIHRSEESNSNRCKRRGSFN